MPRFFGLEQVSGRPGVHACHSDVRLFIVACSKPVPASAGIHIVFQGASVPVIIIYFDSHCCKYRRLDFSADGFTLPQPPITDALAITFSSYHISFAGGRHEYGLRWAALYGYGLRCSSIFRDASAKERAYSLCKASDFCEVYIHKICREPRTNTDVYRALCGWTPDTSLDAFSVSARNAGVAPPLDAIIGERTSSDFRRSAVIQILGRRRIIPLPASSPCC